MAKPLDVHPSSGQATWSSRHARDQWIRTRLEDSTSFEGFEASGFDVSASTAPIRDGIE